MHTGDQTQQAIIQGDGNAAGLRVPYHRDDLLLPVPDQEDVAGFVTLYRSRYGVELEPDNALEILGGLMGFLYLTRRRTPEPPKPPLDG